MVKLCSLLKDRAFIFFLFFSSQMRAQYLSVSVEVTLAQLPQLGTAIIIKLFVVSFGLEGMRKSRDQGLDLGTIGTNFWSLDFRISESKAEIQGLGIKSNLVPRFPHFFWFISFGPQISASLKYMDQNKSQLEKNFTCVQNVLPI